MMMLGPVEETGRIKDCRLLSRMTRGKRYCPWADQGWKSGEVDYQWIPRR